MSFFALCVKVTRKLQKADSMLGWGRPFLVTSLCLLPLMGYPVVLLVLSLFSFLIMLTPFPLYTLVPLLTVVSMPPLLSETVLYCSINCDNTFMHESSPEAYLPHSCFVVITHTLPGPRTAMHTHTLMSTPISSHTITQFNYADSTSHTLP